MLFLTCGLFNLFIMNKKLEKIFINDQEDRKNRTILENGVLLTKRDRDRKKRVNYLISRKQLNSPKDFFMAAMIFHHNRSIEDSRKAVMLSKKSADMGYQKALSLYAVSMDRLLIRQGKKQRFATQYFKKNDASSWKLLPFDKKMSDKERKKYREIERKK